MNRQRRNRIELVMTKLDELREAIENLDSAADGIGDVADYLSDAMGGD